MNTTDTRRPAWWRACAAVSLLGAILALGACNTIGGFGEDVSAGGEALSDTAEDVEQQF